MSRPHSFARFRPDGSPVLVAAASVWALLFGMGLLLLGNGLQYSLLGIRAANEGFSGSVTGIVMSGYFVGFLIGSLATPHAVHRVGHLRVFAAAAALASIAILVHGLAVTPLLWGLMRIVTGLAYAAAYIVTESWLNDRVTNEHRGGLLSVYMIVGYAGMGGGQLLLNAGDPDSAELFILVSVLISAASMPILLSILPQPEMRPPARVGPLDMYRLSPLGTVGCALTGVVQGALFGMGALYARTLGLSVSEISLFMLLLVLGAGIVQWPIGKLSDRIDRRRVILFLALFGALACAAAVPLGGLGRSWTVALAAVLGIAPLTLYSLCIAYANDHVDPARRVGASSMLLLIFGCGAVFGPSLAGATMDLAGANGFLWLIGSVLLVLAAFAQLRAVLTPALPVSEQSHFTPSPQTTPALSAAYIEAREELETGTAPDEPGRGTSSG